MLESIISSKFQITGTWPMRTELVGNLKKNISALASSIVFICRPRRVESISTTRREFMSVLKHELPAALRQLQKGNIAPVDFAQAAIGPGMAIFSRYKAVLEADGTPMRVRTALALINQALDEYLASRRANTTPIRAGRWPGSSSRPRSRPLRRGRDSLQSQEHQRGRPGAGRLPRGGAPAGCACCGAMS